MARDTGYVVYENTYVILNSQMKLLKGCEFIP